MTTPLLKNLSDSPPGLTRRNFLTISVRGGTGLVIGFYIPSSLELEAGSTPSAAAFEPNAFLKIVPSGRVTVWVTKSEMGQGVQTSLPMLIAEELEADWASIHILQGDADKKFGNQGTGGSTSIRTMWKPLREAGAVAREMLIDAAAKTWKVDKSTCSARKGAVIHRPTGRRLSYGSLVASAAKLPVPSNVQLKDPKDFHLLGTKIPRLDTREKVNGKGIFGLDVRRPGMLYATIARCPVFEGKVSSFNATKAKAVPGVRHVVQAGDAVAVVADNTWAAMKGRRALDIHWDEGKYADMNSAGIYKMFEESAEKPGLVARHEGDIEAGLQKAAKKMEATYKFPFLAHATMEPMNCTADVRKDRCEIWAPTQSPDWVQREAAQITGLKPEQVIVHVTLLGGGFGRRAMPDFSNEAVQVSKAVGAPVKVTWTREDDMQHDYYRPASYHRVSGGLDADGWPVAWKHHIVGPSIRAQIFHQTNGLDRGAVDGAAELPYAIPHLHVDYLMANTGVPIGWWRSVWNSQHAFVNECWLDELAAAAGKDAVTLRLKLLEKSPRLKGVVELAADKAGWGKPRPQGRHLGIASHASFGSFVAEIAEVSVAENGDLRVHRVVCAVDCGQIVNPDTIEAQMQSAITFGLTAALYGEITIDKGRVEQSNFNNYDMVRIDEAPPVDVYIVPSKEAPGGIGEPGLPPIAPAVANAIFAATGKRLRQLPFKLKA